MACLVVLGSVKRASEHSNSSGGGVPLAQSSLQPDHSATAISLQRPDSHTGGRTTPDCVLDPLRAA